MNLGGGLTVQPVEWNTSILLARELGAIYAKAVNRRKIIGFGGVNEAYSRRRLH